MRDVAVNHRLVTVLRIAVLPFAAIVILAVIGCIAVALNWPFTRDKVIARLEKATGASVSIGPFRSTWFPPGFSATNCRLIDHKTGAAILTAQTFTGHATWLGLLRQRADEITVKGFHLTVAKSFSFRPSPGSVDASRFIAENGVLEVFPSHPGARPLRVSISRLVLDGLAGGRPKFELAAVPEAPAGDFRATGTLGRLNWNSVQNIPIRGTYTFSHASLGVLGGVSGKLSASGKLEGTLGNLECDGTATIPDFHVQDSAHKEQLETWFRAVVNTSTGDTQLQSIRAKFRSTEVNASGRLSAEEQGQGKTLRVAARIDKGRIDDLLDMFSSQPHPGMTGPIRANATIVLPPEQREFLMRLKVDGSFEIAGGLFTNPQTQTPLNYLSQSAHDASRAQERKSHEQIPATIHASVHGADGVARLSNVQYSMPGVGASAGGTFNLLTKAVAMNGLLTTTGELPDTQSALKAVFMSIAGPFLGIHKKNKTTYFAFTIQGTSKQPVFKLAPMKSGARPEHAALH